MKAFSSVTLVAPLLYLSISGCSVGPEPKPSQEAAALAPSDWREGAVGGVVQSGWIAAFGDLTLVHLVSEAMTNNPDLVISSARLDEAIAYGRRAGAVIYPDLNLQAIGAKVDFPKSPGNLLIGNDSTYLGPSLGISWEIDLWGRLRDAKRNAANLVLASVYDYEYARQSLAAEVAKAWFASINRQLQFDLNLEFVKNYEKTVAIVQARYSGGSVSREDLAQSQSSVSTREPGNEKEGDTTLTRR